jgi:hypothetical protein
VEPDYSWADRDDWQDAWQSAIEAIGEHFPERWEDAETDRIEAGAVGRYLEPLEFDCPLHWDASVAKAHGYPDIIAPYSGLATWVSIGVWRPGDDPVYLGNGRDEQPRWRSEGRRPPQPGPDVDGIFATDIDIEYRRPFVVGERLSLVGRKLISVVPKQTSVGRGAFLTFESEVRNEQDELIATQRICMYRYVTMKPA